MFSKINHIAISSSNYSLLPRFYESVFGMKNGSVGRPATGITVGDGYVGINFNPRRAGRVAGLDHFGIQVDDCETVFDRMRKKYPTVDWLKRPASRPFAITGTWFKSSRPIISSTFFNGVSGGTVCRSSRGRMTSLK